jgi:hypothetical protein
VRSAPEDQEFITAARAAWGVYGPEIMLRWRKRSHPTRERQKPEALLRFGRP